MKIAIIGAGNIGRALAFGLAQSTLVKAEDICISNTRPEKLERIKGKSLRRADVAFNDRDAVIEGERAPLAYLEVLKLECCYHFNCGCWR